MSASRIDPRITAQWARVRGQLRAEVGDASYRSWLKPLTLVGIIDGMVRLAVPTQFMRDWVASHYGDRVQVLWNDEDATLDGVDIFVQPRPQKPLVRQVGARAAAVAPPAGSDAGSADIASFSVPLDPRCTFDNFVVGKPNELAHAAARRIADSETAAYNPLFLYGGVGLGKTHLMHAIAHHTRHRFPQRKVVYLSAEKFMYHFIRALRFKDTVAFKDERLRSRLGWGLVADIHSTNFELRLSILESKSAPLGIDIPAKVKEFLAHRITTNVRELEGALNRVVAHATLVGREITLDSCQDVLQDILRANNRRVTIEDIQRRVAEHFNIRMTDMHSARRARAIARPRQVAMYLAKQLTARSLPEIGRKFGGRDHTTVMHAVRKVEELRGSDAAFCEDVDLLRRMLEG